MMLMHDQFGREINYLRISVTDLCNLRCQYCMPAEGVSKKSHSDILRFEEIVAIVHAAARMGISKVRITGGEPLVRPGIVSLIQQISHVPDIRDLAMTTNAVLLAPLADSLKHGGLDRVNISLDTLDADKYRQITRGGILAKALAGIDAALAVGLRPVKVNVVLIRGFNDSEIAKFIELANTKAIEVRFIELMPLGDTSDYAASHYLKNNIVLEKHPDLQPIGERNTNGPAKLFRQPGAKGTIGLINPISGHICATCNRLRITADGKLRPCLHSDFEIDIREQVQQGHALEQILQMAVTSKPECHHLTDGNTQRVHKNMHRIGG